MCSLFDVRVRNLRFWEGRCVGSHIILSSLLNLKRPAMGYRVKHKSRGYLKGFIHHSPMKANRPGKPNDATWTYDVSKARVFQKWNTAYIAAKIYGCEIQEVEQN